MRGRNAATSVTALLARIRKKVLVSPCRTRFVYLDSSCALALLIGLGEGWFAVRVEADTVTCT